jgi:hypothetical protein
MMAEGWKQAEKLVAAVVTATGAGAVAAVNFQNLLMLISGIFWIKISLFV